MRLRTKTKTLGAALEAIKAGREDRSEGVEGGSPTSTPRTSSLLERDRPANASNVVARASARPTTLASAAVTPIGADGQHDRDLSDLEREAIAILEGAQRRDGSEAGLDPTPQRPDPADTASASNAIALTSVDGRYAALGRPSAANRPASIPAGGDYAEFGSSPAVIASIDSLTARHRVAGGDSSPTDGVSTKCESGYRASGTVECLERADASGLQTPQRTLLRRGLPAFRKANPAATAATHHPHRLRLKPRGLLGALLACTALYAPSAASAAECPNEQLRESGSSRISPATGQPYDASLLDCRAYEQVSPVEKDGGSGGVLYDDSLGQEDSGFLFRSSDDGTVVTYPGEPFYHVESIAQEVFEVAGTPVEAYTSERLSDGWYTEIGEFLNPEQVPAPVVPTSIAPAPKILEESPSGSEIFYLEGGDLYEYRASSDTSTDLTPDTEPGGADVQGILGVGGEGAEEGTYVYLVAGGTLAPLASKGGCSVISGGETRGTGCNLYLLHNGSFTLIATLSERDENEGKASLGAGDVDWSGPGERTAEVSPNGRYVAFGSDLALTGQGTGRSEIFRYDAETQTLICVSCTSSGPQSGGAVNLVSTAAEINGAYRQRYMLDDGRVFFDTTNALVPQDVNDQTDVYEWEPAAVGSCSAASTWFSELSGGCVDLISGGTSDAAPGSVLADVSASGSDVFFTTSQALVPQDGDEITDLYDAREGGGFPPPPAATCPAEADCRPGTSSAVLVPSATGTNSAAELPPPAVNRETKSTTSRSLTRAQKLAKALKACSNDKRKTKRKSCEQQARAKYGPKKKAKKPTTNGRAK
jgi:hypothetical protein